MTLTSRDCGSSEITRTRWPAGCFCCIAAGRQQLRSFRDSVGSWCVNIPGGEERSYKRSSSLEDLKGQGGAAQLECRVHVAPCPLPEARECAYSRAGVGRGRQQALSVRKGSWGLVVTSPLDIPPPWPLPGGPAGDDFPGHWQYLAGWPPTRQWSFKFRRWACRLWGLTLPRASH